MFMPLMGFFLAFPIVALFAYLSLKDKPKDITLSKLFSGMMGAILGFLLFTTLYKPSDLLGVNFALFVLMGFIGVRSFDHIHERVLAAK